MHIAGRMIATLICAVVSATYLSACSKSPAPTPPAKEVIKDPRQLFFEKYDERLKVVEGKIPALSAADQAAITDLLSELKAMNSSLVSDFQQATDDAAAELEKTNSITAATDSFNMTMTSASYLEKISKRIGKARKSIEAVTTQNQPASGSLPNP